MKLTWKCMSEDPLVLESCKTEHGHRYYVAENLEGNICAGQAFGWRSTWLSEPVADFEAGKVAAQAHHDEQSTNP